MLRLTALFFLVFALVPGAAADSGYDASYSLTLGPIKVGAMQRSYRIDDDGRYRFVSEIRSTGLAAFMRSDELTEISAGIVEDGVHVPERYSYERKNKRKPRSVATVFNRVSGTIETVYNGQQRNGVLEAGMLDKLVYQAQIMRDLAAGKTELRYPVTDRGQAKVYTPVVAGEERVETGAGDFDTVKVVRERQKDKKRTIFWCAPALDFLPVRVAHREKNGNETIVELESFTTPTP